MTKPVDFSKKLDLAASVLTIVLVAAIATILVRNGFFSAQPRASARPLALQVGSHVPTALSVRWVTHPHTLVMGLQTTCHFCSESGPFLHTLTNNAPSNLGIVAVLPQTSQAAKKYLDGMGVRTDAIRQLPLASIGIPATPTLMLVNSLGVIEDIWTGEQNSEGEASIVSALQEGVSANETPNTRRVRLARRTPDEPARVVLIKEGGVDVTPGVRPYKSWEGKPFQGGDDWVKNLSFTIENLSNKDIVAINVSIDFPEGNTPSQMIGYNFTLGRMPLQYVGVPNQPGETVLRQPDKSASPIDIKSGKEMTVTLDRYYEQIKNDVETFQPMSSTSTCWIVLSCVYFADKTKWAYGVFYKPDPGQPGSFIRMSADEFWGRTQTTY